MYRRGEGAEILIVGGAGYIGSHANKILNKRGFERQILGWQPQYTSLDEIIKTAWHWHSLAKRH